MCHHRPGGFWTCARKSGLCTCARRSCIFTCARKLGLCPCARNIKHFQQGSLQPEGPESRILVLPSQAAPFLPSACNSGLTFCELDHLPSAASYPTSHVRKLTHKLKRLRGSILLQPVVNNVTDSTITDFLKRYICHILFQGKG